jgi:polysaccharide biosynthesis protein PslH
LLDGLAKAGHTIDLMTLIDVNGPDPSTTPLATLCHKIITIPAPRRRILTRLRDLFLSRRADMERRVYAAQFVSAVKSQLAFEDYDLVQLESLETAAYLPVIKARRPALPIIYDSFNAEFDLQRLIFEIDVKRLSRLHGAVYSFIQWRRLVRFERRVCETVDYVIAVSEADAEAFRKLAPQARVAVVPNGIYADEYQGVKTQQLELGPAPLLFTGTMNYRPNVDAVVWFANEVLPEVRKIIPDARLFVVGNRPHARLDKLRQRDDIEITGYVQDVLPFLQSAMVYVAPLRMGSGTRLKLLQAMAVGCAIVATSVGAQGLDVTSGREMMLADTSESFAQATVSLLRDADLRVKMGEAARKVVCDKYDWSVIVPKLLAVYKDIGANQRNT